MGLIRKVIFLDIDGVLNSAQNAEMFNRLNDIAGKIEWRPHSDFCPVAISNLCSILESNQDIKLVISSTWRLGCDNLADLKAIFDVLNPAPLRELIESRIIDRTPALRDKERGIEIQKWLDDNKEKLDPEFQFVILDDDSDMAHLRSKLVRTSGYNGLVWTDAQKVRQGLMTSFEADKIDLEEACRQIYRSSFFMTLGKEIKEKVEEIRELLNSPDNQKGWPK